MNGNGERKKVRLFGIDSEPGVYDAWVEELEDGVFELKSMKKVGEWQKRDQKMELEEKINCPSNFGEVLEAFAMNASTAHWRFVPSAPLSLGTGQWTNPCMSLT